MKLNTLKNHIAAFGDAGRFTFHAGLTMTQAEAIGPEAVKLSALHAFQCHDRVIIRGTLIPVTVEQVAGTFLILTSYGDGSWQEFDRVKPPKGRYSYGRIHIHKGHVELASWDKS